MSEVGVLTAAAVWAGPKEGVATLLAPIARKVVAEGTGVHPPGGGHLSSGQVGRTPPIAAPWTIIQCGYSNLTIRVRVRLSLRN